MQSQARPVSPHVLQGSVPRLSAGSRQASPPIRPATSQPVPQPSTWAAARAAEAQPGLAQLARQQQGLLSSLPMPPRLVVPRPQPQSEPAQLSAGAQAQAPAQAPAQQGLPSWTPASPRSPGSARKRLAAATKLTPKAGAAAAQRALLMRARARAVASLKNTSGAPCPVSLAVLDQPVQGLLVSACSFASPRPQLQAAAGATVQLLRFPEASLMCQIADLSVSHVVEAESA